MKLFLFVALVLVGCGEEPKINEGVRFDIVDPSDEDVGIKRAPEAKPISDEQMVDALVRDGYFADALDSKRDAIWEAMPKAKQNFLVGEIAAQTEDGPLTDETMKVDDLLARRAYACGYVDAQKLARRAIKDYRRVASEGTGKRPAAHYLLKADSLAHHVKLTEGSDHELAVAQIWAWNPGVCSSDKEFCSRHPMTAELAPEVLKQHGSGTSHRLAKVLDGFLPEDQLRSYVVQLKHSYIEGMVEYSHMGSARGKLQDQAELFKKYGVYPEDLEESLAYWHVSGILQELEITQCDRSAAFLRHCEILFKRALAIAVRSNLDDGLVRTITRLWRAERIQSDFFQVGLLENGEFILLPPN